VDGQAGFMSSVKLSNPKPGHKFYDHDRTQRLINLM
jgi:hypothetical protein